MQAVEKGIDEQDYKPSLVWKVDEMRIYDAWGISRQWNDKLKKDVMYFRGSKDHEAVILDFPPATQLQLLAEETDAGKYMWLRLTEGKSYSNFLSKVSEVEKECRPRFPGYRFKRENFARMAKGYARLFFEVNFS